VSRKSIALIASVMVCCALSALPAVHAAGPKAASRTAPDGPLGTGPDAWDANRDGVYTCEEWKSYLDRWFATADRNRDGRLDPTEFATLRRPNTFFADADFGYFDENQDGKITHEEFVGKPNEFILQNDKNGDCRVTPEEMKGAGETPKAPGGRGRGGGGGSGGMR
jgi:hypothetical protein